MCGAFGELVLWKRRPTTGAMATFICLWEETVFLGVKATSAKHMAVSPMGVVKTRTIARTPAGERWMPRVLEMPGGIPKRFSESDPDMDAEPMMMQVSREVELCTANKQDTRRSVRKRMYVVLFNNPPGSLVKPGMGSNTDSAVCCRVGSVRLGVWPCHTYLEGWGRGES